MSNEKINDQKFVIQPNAISRSIHSVSTYGKRLMTMAMSLLPIDEKTEKPTEYTVTFTGDEFLHSLGLENGRKQHDLISSAVYECMGNLIKIKTDEKFTVFTWFTKTEVLIECTYDCPIKNISMSFNPELAEAIGSFRKQFTKMNLLDFGKLQSKYAIRFYEIAISWIGMKGIKGNSPGCWWFEFTLPELRERFAIDQNKYKATKDFRVRVIDDPIEEINAADIGIRIEPEYKYFRRKLVKVVFQCQELERDEPRPTQPATETGRSAEELKNKYPDEYEKLFNIALAESKAQNALPGFTINHETCAEAEAIKQLQEKHPEKKRGRKK